MTDTNKPEPGAPEASSTQAGTPPGADATVAASGPDQGAGAAMDEAAGETGREIPLEQLRAIVSVLQIDLDKVRADNVRLLADMDNLRKRTEREKSDTAKYAVTRFAQDVVGVVDSFERAASAVSSEAAAKDAALKSFLDGIVLAERNFLSVLERHGVRRFDPQGQAFNPHHHQAVMEREDAKVPAGTVLQVFQAGYMIEDRCLRPAMVVVSRGGAKAAKPAPEAAAGEAPAAGAQPGEGTGPSSG